MRIDKIRIRTSSTETETIIEATTERGLYTGISNNGILSIYEFPTPKGISYIRCVFKDWTRYYLEYKEAN